MKWILVALALCTFCTLAPRSANAQCTIPNTGSALLTWTPPTQNTDGTPLTNLSGYKVYWGPAQGNYTSSTQLNTPSLVSYQVTGLVPRAWFFVVTALAASGTESQFSNVATKTVAGTGTTPVTPMQPSDFTMTPVAPAVVTTVANTRMAFIGDTFSLTVPNITCATRYEWELFHLENRITNTRTGQTILWTATRSGHIAPRVRACNDTVCGAWLSSLDRGWISHYWIRPPTF